MRGAASLIDHADQNWLYAIGRLEGGSYPAAISARATTALRAVQQRGVVTSSALQRNAEPIMPRRLIASTAQRHRRLGVTESAHRDRHPLHDPNCKV